jgi:hypothetical protein
MALTLTISTGCSLIPNFSKNEQPTEQKLSTSINQCIQNFNLDWRKIISDGNVYVSATIPPNCLEQNFHIKELLQKSQGRVKDTKFNRVDVSNLTGTFINDGYKVDGDWKLQHREVIFKNPINGHTNYTPWSDDTGKFSQEVSMRIDNGTIVVQATKHSFSRDGQGLIRDLLGDFLVYGKGNFRDQLVAKIRDGMNEYNGKPIADMLIKNGLAKQLTTQAPIPINEQLAITGIKSACQRINARISPKGLDISLDISLPKL